MYVMNKKWDSITNIAQCTSVYVSPEHEIKAVPTGGGAVYRLGQYETAEIARAVLNDLYIHVATGCTYQMRRNLMNLIREIFFSPMVVDAAGIILIVAALPMVGWSWAVSHMAGPKVKNAKEGT